MSPRLFLVFVLVLLPGLNPAAAEDSINVTVVGKLRTGILAIGGETTGTTITAKGITWELDFGKNAGLRKTAEKLSGKTVRVGGSLERRKGVEIRERWIITVTALKAFVNAKPGATDKPGLRASAKRAGTRIEMGSPGDKTLVDIKCERGIDTATIVRESKTWPKTMLVRLHLRGLESFRVSANKTEVEWSVSSSGNHQARVSLRKGGKDEAIGKNNAYFTEARIVGGERKIPLKGGHFEIELPAKLFEANPSEITLSWIDFYRN